MDRHVECEVARQRLVVRLVAGTAALTHDDLASGARATRDQGEQRAVSVRLSGDLDLASLGVLGDLVDRVPPGVGDVVVDLTELTFVDVAGFDALTDVLAHLRRRHLTVTVEHRPHLVRLLAGILGLDNQLRPLGETTSRLRSRAGSPPSRRAAAGRPSRSLDASEEHWRLTAGDGR